MNGYITIPEAAVKWGVRAQQVRMVCETARIRGVIRLRQFWLIPEDAVVPPELQAAASKRRILA